VSSSGSAPSALADYVAAGIAPGSFISGNYDTADAAYSEVGLARLNLMDADYHGHSIAADAINLGRFIPARFDVSGNLPLFAPACGTFTYLAQPFGFQVDPVITLAARNADGDYTRNYGGAYWKFNPALAGRAYQDSAGTAATLSVDGSASAVSLEGEDDFDAAPPTLTVSGDLFEYSRPVSALNPFAAQADFLLARADLIDSDGVCHHDASGICNTNRNGAAGSGFLLSGIVGPDQRYGRGVIEDTYGTMGRVGDSLSLLLKAEYWDLSNPLSAQDGWLENLDDGCTALDYTLGGSSISVSAAPASPVALQNGLRNVVLITTGDPGGDGGRQVLTPVWPAWLPGGAGTATFGIFRGDDRFIHWSEQ